jgi:hypothetical protein
VGANQQVLGASGGSARVSRRPTVGLVVSFGLGFASSLSALGLDVPGNGVFEALTWIAGFVAILITPGRRGLVAVVAGATVSAAIIDASDGTMGLVFIIVTIVAGLAAHGALVGGVVRRVAVIGLRRSLRDRWVLAGSGLALGLAALFVWAAIELAANPI